MSSKTEFAHYNEDNFVERDGNLREITVEITLEEYRNLIVERTYNEKELEKFQEENTSLNDSVKTLTAFFINTSPELKEKLSSLLITTFEEVEKALKIIKAGVNDDDR